MSNDMASAAPIDEVPEPFVEGAAEEQQLLRKKMLHILEVFPFLSLSHIHMSLGTACSRRLWVPVLDALVEEGLITLTTLQAKTPLDRNQTYKVYHLTTRAYEDTTLIHVVSKPSA